MQFAKRIFLFLLTNIAVIIVLDIVLTLLTKYFWIKLSAVWFWIPQLLVYAFVVGFVGAFISLFMSKWIAKTTYNIQLIDVRDLSHVSKKQRVVYDIIYSIAEKNNMTLPEIWFYQSWELNAFATGATRNRSLVAVSSWLIDTMSADEIEWVIGHEMTHILNGDMVTMTLMQGVVNTFVVFVSRLIANIVDMFFRGNSESEHQWYSYGPSIIYFIVSMVLEISLSLLASLLVMWFSRYREYRADEGSARMLGKGKMIAALQALKRAYESTSLSDSSLATYKISSKERSGISSLLSSHPSLDDRITRIQNIIL